MKICLEDLPWRLLTIKGCLKFYARLDKEWLRVCPRDGTGDLNLWGEVAAIRGKPVRSPQPQTEVTGPVNLRLPRHPDDLPRDLPEFRQLLWGRGLHVLRLRLLRSCGKEPFSPRRTVSCGRPVPRKRTPVENRMGSCNVVEP